MNLDKRRNIQKRRRHYHVRNSVHGTAERPRLTVFRSIKNISVQIINDDTGLTLASSGTLKKGLKKDLKAGSDKKAASIVGTDIAKAALEAGIKKVAFDRGPNKFHGRVKALADAARKAGLEF